MLTVRLPQSIEKRPQRLARPTGRTTTFYVLGAILKHREDLERRRGSLAAEKGPKTPWHRALNCGGSGPGCDEACAQL